ncbi:uncharacterized protein LOC5521474 [Nematostella vectensis]|uniref:uncharacterized protein LOC5521474 n=1 Tax=Nematostella vectensis TaxID=45351 RepID=UPI00138FC687|nr:uncharacterized protein LOC5521474 [Nematostella vectensis]
MLFSTNSVSVPGKVDPPSMYGRRVTSYRTQSPRGNLALFIYAVVSDNNDTNNMANRAVAKFSTWTKETYIDPKNMPANRYYTPSLYTSFGDIPSHGAGREKWFHDYRRSNIAERTLRNGQLSMNPPPIRPTSFSDNPDRVLGKRTMRREAILNKPRHHLENRIPDRERERCRIDDLTFYHRQQYRDPSGSLYEHRVPYYHYPTEAEEQFLPRVRQEPDTMGSYPNYRRAASESVYDFKRGPKVYELWHKV